MEPDPITVRARQFIQVLGNAYKFLEEVTGVASTRWRDLNHGKTRAVPADMLHALCEMWPEFAFWFATGTKKSQRVQTTPHEYYDLPYGKVGAVEWGAINVFRDKNGILQPDLGDQNIEDKKSQAYEVSLAFRLLKFSSFASYDDAEALASTYWKTFLKPLKKGGQSLTMTRKELKQWINQFPITEPKPPAENYPTRYFLATPHVPLRNS